MKKEDFFEVLGELDADIVKEVKTGMKEKVKRPVWVKGGTMAACLCLFATGIFLYRAENRYPLKIMTDNSISEIAKVPRWDDMEIYQQYDKIVVEGLEYNTNHGEIPTEQLGTKICDVVAMGWDEYADVAGKDAEHYYNAVVYEIQNVSTQCAVAVQYEGTSICYAAINSSYRPETLAQFIEDIDLQNNMIVNWASYDYRKPISGLSMIRFENLDANKVWDLLLSNTAAINEYDELDFEQPKKILDICVSVPILGYENISISIREDGYIITNILSTGKSFCIGEKYTKAFVAYVLDDCDGYELY